MPRLIDQSTEIEASASTVQSSYPVDHAIGDCDFLIALRDVNTSVWTRPAGWVTIGNTQTGSQTTLRWAIWWRFYESGDSAPNLTAGATANLTASIVSWRGIPKHELTITGITQANPAVLTYTGTDPTNGQVFGIHSVAGMVEVNGNLYTVANVDTGAKTFELSGTNSTGFTAYTSGGKAVRSPVNALGQAHLVTASADMPAATSTENNCAVWYLAMLNNANNAARPIFLEPGACYPTRGIRGSDTEIAWTTSIVPTAGAVPVPRCAHQAEQQKGAYTIVLRDAGNGYVEPHIPVDETKLILLGMRTDNPTDQAEIAGTWTDPTSDFATILGATNYYYNPANQGLSWVTAGLFNQSGIWGDSFGESMSTLTGGAGWASFRFTPTSALDMTGKQLVVHLGSHNAGGGAYLLPPGAIVTLQSSSTDWVMFQVKQAWFADQIAGYVFDADYATPIATNGTFNKAAVTGIQLSQYVNNSNNNYRVQGYFWLLGKASICGGGSAKPVTTDDIGRMLKWRPADTAFAQGSAQILLRQSVEIGNSGYSSNIDLSNSAVEFAASSAVKGQFLAPGSLTFSVNNRTGDILNARSCLFTSANPWNFAVNASTTGDNDFTAATIINAGTVTLDSNPDFSGVNFIECGVFSLGDCNLSSYNVTIDACTETYVFTVTSQAELNALGNTTFTNNNTCIRVNVADTVTTLNFPGQIFGSSNTYAVEYTNDHNIEFTRSGGCDLTIDKVNETGAGTVTLNTGTTITVSAPNLLNGTRCRLVNVTNSGAVTSITRSSSTATVTKTAHGLETGWDVTIVGADQTEYNGNHVIAVTSADTFTYTVSGTPATPATGDIEAEHEINNVVTSGGSGYSLTVTVDTDTEIQSGDSIVLLGTYQSGGTAKNVFRGSAVAGSANITFPDSQTDWVFHNDAGVDGSTVSECETDFVNVEVEIDDDDNSTAKKRVAAFLADAITTEDGIRYWVALDGAPIIRYINAGSAVIDFAVAAVRINNIKNANLRMNDSFKLRASDGSSLIVGTTYTIEFDNTEEAVVVSVSGDSVITGDISEVIAAMPPDPDNAGIAAIKAKTDNLPASPAATGDIPSVAAISAEVISAAESSPIHADTKKMNGATVAGTGVTGDLWRGAA